MTESLYDEYMIELAARAKDLRDLHLRHSEQALRDCELTRGALLRNLRVYRSGNQLSRLAYGVCSSRLLHLTAQELQRARTLCNQAPALPAQHASVEEYREASREYRDFGAEVSAIRSRFLALIRTFLTWLESAGLAIVTWLLARAANPLRRGAVGRTDFEPPTRFALFVVPRAIGPPWDHHAPAYRGRGPPSILPASIDTISQ